MHPDLELLVQLQGIDYDIGELERSKDYMPDMMNSLQREIDAASTAVTDSEAELLGLTTSQKTLELELGSMQEDLKRYKSQMMAIKTNKEYDALVTEIDTLKTHVAEKESGIMAAEERMEELKSSMDTLKSNSEQIGETNGKQLKNLKKKLENVGGKVAGQEHERQKLASQVSRATLSVYERVRRGKGASVVVTVRKGACSGCFKSIPPQRLQEIRRGVKVIICDNCGRLLTPEAA